jgi:hypothetical protein
MPCGCSTTLAPCEVPRLVPVSSYSESHDIVLESQLYDDGSPSLLPVVLATAMLAAALSRHFRPWPLCVVNLAGRDTAAFARGSRTARSRAVRRPFRLVLSTQERVALNVVRRAARSVFRRASVQARLPFPVRLAEAPRTLRS